MYVCVCVSEKIFRNIFNFRNIVNYKFTAKVVVFHRILLHLFLCYPELFA